MPRLGEIDITYLTLLETENKIKLLQSFVGAKQHHNMQCLTCNHIWNATPLSKRQTFKKHGVSGCPNCNNNRKEHQYNISRTKNLKTLAARHILILTPNYDGRHHIVDENTYTKIRVKNLKCGHEFECSPSNLLAQHVDCAICGPLSRVAPLTAWSKANSAKWKETATEWQKYKAQVTALTEQTYTLHKKHINPLNLPRGKAGVEGAYHLDHLVPKRFCFDNSIPPEVCADVSNLQMIGWRENVGSRDHVKGTLPPLFLRYVSANTKLETYAAQLQLIIPHSERFVKIADIIVTVYDQATNRAIVVIPTDRSYANQKSALATQRSLAAAGVSFIILFEDEMKNTSLLQAKLLHYTNRGIHTRIHARQCIVRLCSKEEKKQLLDTNHIQGNDNAPVAYGAYFNDKLVAVMTFSPPRIALGQKGNKDRSGQWELSRFCTDVTHRIPGIASKLLTTFKRNHSWTEIYSYADKRWSVGNMYHQLGFTLIADNPPDYFYVIEGTRKHRWNYRKDLLKTKLDKYDPTLTEYQNMENHGFWRVWDCGTLKFSISNG
jgi:hypothetical protein